MTGNDGNAGTSAGAAWLTVGHAINNVAAGDTIYIGAGTYDEYVYFGGTALAGTSGNPIQFIGDTDGSQTGDAGDVIFTRTSNNLVLSIRGDFANHDYLTFKGLTINGGIYCPRNTGTLFEDCEIYGDTGNNLQIWGGEATLRRCSIHDNAGSGLDIWDYTDTTVTVTLEDCSVYNNGNYAGVFGQGTSYLTVTRCHIYNNAVHGVKGSGGSTMVTNCLIEGNTSAGVYGNSATPATIHNCTIVNNGSYGVYDYTSTSDLKNCIIANNGSAGIQGSLPHTYNLVYNNGSSNYGGGASQDTTEIIADPEFVSSTDYRVRSLSPAVNAGADMTGTVDDDIEGLARPYDGAWDIGCYEMAPEGHWKLDETSGTTAADSSGRGYDGTYTGSPTLGVAGQYGSAVDLAASDYVEISGEMGRPKSVTLAAWVDLDVAAAGGSEVLSIDVKWTPIIGPPA